MIHIIQGIQTIAQPESSFFKEKLAYNRIIFRTVQDLDKIVEQEEEARSSRKAIRKITYKGEVEIEAEKTEAIEVCFLHH